MTPREGETEGVVGTRTLQFAGADGGAAPELLINADARSGTVRVQLSHGGWNAGKGPGAAPGFAVEGFAFGQSAVLRQSELHWQPTWGSGSTVRLRKTSVRNGRETERGLKPFIGNAGYGRRRAARQQG